MNAPLNGNQAPRVLFIQRSQSSLPSWVSLPLFYRGQNRHAVTCPSSHSKWMAKLKLASQYPDSQSRALSVLPPWTGGILNGQNKNYLGLFGRASLWVKIITYTCSLDHFKMLTFYNQHFSAIQWLCHRFILPAPQFPTCKTRIFITH